MKKRILVALPIIFGLICADQITKLLVRSLLHPLMSVELLPFLNIVNVRNTGAAFGMFSSLGNSFFIAVSLLAIAFMIWIILSGREDHRIFSLLAGGAAGNLVDRVRLGYVVDFIDVGFGTYHWPAFNVADAALSVGIALLFVKIIRGSR